MLVSAGEGKVCGRLLTDEAGLPIFRQSMVWNRFQELVRISAFGVSLAGAAGATQIQMNVTDGASAVLPGAKVTITDAKTSVTVGAGVTSADGSLTTEVPTGKYLLQIESAGFQEQTLIVSADQPLQTIDIAMNVGLLGEVVVVSSGKPSSWRYLLFHPKTWL